MLFLAAALVAGLSSQPVPHDSVPLYPDLGDHHHAITTTTPEAQRYFDQGLRLVYGFNHPEAIRSFRRAQQLDPNCAMCYWGEALALGPNINVLMDSASGAAAYAAIQRALTLGSGATEKERALIRALASRYGKNPTADRKALDSAYARSMADVARRFPNDDDAAVLHAEAYMLLGPWDYWTPEKKAKSHGAAALAALEPVVARSPNHAGACHFFIHAVEAAFPERAIACAERLPTLMPGAGHVVHMPAHIYIRVGRYADAIDRNVHALHADAPYLKDMAPDGVYRLALHPHNGHFLSFAASMIGRSAQAMEAARLTKEKVDPQMMRAPGLGALQHYYMLPVFTMVRFGQWDDVLAEPPLEEDLPYPNAIRGWARAVAFAAKRDTAQSARELEALKALRRDARLASVTIWDLNPTTALLDIAIEVASAELALARGDAAAAVRHLRRGVEIEDGLTYDEPPPWHQPVRQQLGKALLAARRPAEAETVFRRDLDRHPENGWSLHGLALALTARGQRAEAEAVRKRFQKAWSTADVEVETRSASRGASRAAKKVWLSTGVRAHYVEAGQARGEPIILLHGYTDSWKSYGLVLDGLARHGRVLALDFRGHGASDKPASGYAPAELAKDVVAFLDALGISRARVVGHSLGSIVAQHLAAAVPDRVTKLVLVGSTADPRNELMREFERTIASFTESVPAEFVSEFQRGSAYAPVPESFMADAIATSRTVPPHVWRDVVAGLASTSARAELARITAPTLILWGEKDATFGRAEQVALAAGIRGSTLTIYQQTGHSPHWEQPARFVRDVGAFLETRAVTRLDKNVVLRNGVRLHYVEAGDPRGEPIILLHGYSDSWRSFDLVLDDLARQGRVLALDQRGHGASDKPLTGYTMPEMAADVVAFMDALGIQRARVLGHSMGSIIAQHVAATAPERVSRLVLVASSFDSRTDTMRELLRMVEAYTDSVPLSFIREFQYGSIHTPVAAEFMEGAIAASRALPMHVWRGVIDGLTGDGAPAALDRISAPTLILWGPHDALFSRREQDGLLAGIRGATLSVYEHTGHTPHWEFPARFSREVTAFLAAEGAAN